MITEVFDDAMQAFQRHETAQRLGLVTLDRMVNALVIAVESPAASRGVQVPEIRRYTRISTP